MCNVYLLLGVLRNGADEKLFYCYKLTFGCCFPSLAAFSPESNNRTMALVCTKLLLLFVNLLVLYIITGTILYGLKANTTQQILHSDYLIHGGIIIAGVSQMTAVQVFKLQNK